MTDDPTQRDLDDVEALAERMVAAATAAEVAEPAPVAEPLPTVSATLGRVVDPGSLVIGIWFVLAGLVAAVLGADALEDLPPIVIPTLLRRHRPRPAAPEAVLAPPPTARLVASCGPVAAVSSQGRRGPPDRCRRR